MTQGNVRKFMIDTFEEMTIMRIEKIYEYKWFNSRSADKVAYGLVM